MSNMLQAEGLRFLKYFLHLQLHKDARAPGYILLQKRIQKQAAHGRVRAEGVNLFKLVGDEEQAERREENARKLYMAMTRAGQKLFVMSSQRLSAEIEALFDDA